MARDFLPGFFLNSCAPKTPIAKIYTKILVLAGEFFVKIIPRFLAHVHNQNITHSRSRDICGYGIYFFFMLLTGAQAIQAKIPADNTAQLLKQPVLSEKTEKNTTTRSTEIEPVSPNIHFINHVTDITPYIKADGPLTIVCLDVDETLLYPKEPKAADAWFGQQVAKLIKEGQTPDQAVKETVIEQLAAHRKTDVCQADWDQDELVAALKKRGVHVICLTARSIDFVDITYRQLKQVLIDVSQTGIWDRCYVLKNLPRPAYYVPGIIFATGNNKGDTLEQFLLQLKYKPTHIIMVDDTRKHIEALDKATKRMGIRYDGFVIEHTYHKRLPCVTMRDGATPHRDQGPRASN